jgi:hypothetical protein
MPAESGRTGGFKSFGPIHLGPDQLLYVLWPMGESQTDGAVLETICSTLSSAWSSPLVDVFWQASIQLFYLR